MTTRDYLLTTNESVEALLPNAPLRRITRCAGCAKADRLSDGSLVCSRFGCFPHATEPDGFCSWGEERR